MPISVPFLETWVFTVPGVEKTSTTRASKSKGGLDVGWGAKKERGSIFPGLIDDVRTYNWTGEAVAHCSGRGKH